MSCRANQTISPVAATSWAFQELRRRRAASRNGMATATAIRAAPSSHHGQAEDSVVVDVGCADTIDVVADGGVGVTVTVSTGVDKGVGAPVDVAVTCAVSVVCAVCVTCAVS